MTMKLTKKLRSVIALMLALCMTLGTVGTSLAEDAPEDKGTIHYVSLGDSMTNGYCFDGYEQGNGDAIKFFEGKGVYGKGAYPLQIEEWLGNQGYEVKHTKLAPSAMRAEDLNYLLGGREMPTDDWYDEVNGYTKVYDNEALSKFYQEAVTDADLITLCIGNASFGAFMLHRVTDALGIFNAEWTDEDAELVKLENALIGLNDEEKEVILQIYNDMKAELAHYVPAELAEQFNVEDICNIVAYCAAGFLANYKGVLDRIVELNPNCEIILVGLMNTTYGMTVTMDGMDPIPVGDIMDGVFSALNAYVAGVPAAMQAAGEWQGVKFYYAEDKAPLFISQEFAELKDNSWGNIQDERLSGKIVRERNITAYNDSLREIISDAFAEMLNTTLPEINLDDVQNYENGVTDSTNPLKSVSAAIYLGIEDAVAASTDTMDIPLTGLIKIATSIESVFEGIDFTSYQDSSGNVDYRKAIGGYLTSTDEMKGMCKIYALFKVGNGMSVHPTPEGHDNLTAAIIEAYSAGHTAEDETMDNLVEAAQILGALAAEYYDEAYAYAYDKADEAGYIDAAVAAIDEVIAALNSIDVSGTQMTDAFKAELAAAVEEAIETLVEAQKLIKEADELDQATLDALMTLLTEAGEASWRVVELLKQATLDVGSLVVDPALQTAYDKAVEAYNKLMDDVNTAIENLKAAVWAGTDYLLEKLGEAYDAFVEAVVKAVEDAADMIPNAAEVADWIYDYLYNNPDKVIAFFNEYGDEIAAFFDEYKEEIVMLLGWLISNYGEDIVTYIIDNADVIVPAMIDWIDEHGENAWALIMVYIEELGLLDKLPTTDELMDAINDALTDLGKLIDEYGDELLENVYAYLEAQGYIDMLNEAIEDLKAELADRTEDFINNIKPQIEAAIKALEEKLECLQQQLKDLKAELEEKKAELEQMIGEGVEEAIKELEKIIAEIEAAIEVVEEKIAEIKAAIEELQDAIEKIEAQLAELADRIAALEEAAKELYEAVINAAEEGYEAVKEAYETAKAALEQAVELVETAYAEIVEALEQITGLAEWIEDAAEALNEYVEEFLADLIEKAENLLDEVKSAVVDAIGEALEELLDAVAHQIKIAAEEILDQVVAALEPHIENLVEAAKDLAEQAVAALEDLVDQVVEAFEDAYEKATSDKYDITCKSYYVAIGDMSAEADSYVELLKNELTGLKGCANLAGDYTIADMPAKLQDPAYVAEILKADLITVGFGNAAFLEKALNEALAGGYAGEDWTALVGETLAPYVEQALAELESELIEAGLDADYLGFNPKEAVMAAAESYLYSAVTYSMYLPEVVNAIHQINPEAAVVIVGMYNPMDDVTIDVSMGGEKMVLNFGGYLDYLVDAAELHGVLYAMITGNAIYVEAPEVTTPWTELGRPLTVFGDLLNAVKGDELGTKLSPDDAGHEYIKDQIMDALTVTTDAEHKYELTDSREATCTEDGYKVWTCSVCGDTYTETIEAAGHTGEVFCGNCGQHLCEGGANCPSAQFVDLDVSEDSWYHEFTDYVLYHKLMYGMSVNPPLYFEPETETTRAMVVAVLYRLAVQSGAVTAADYVSPFEDVEDGQWYTNAIVWAEENGIAYGYGDGTFGPDDVVTREQIAAFFHRYADYAGVEVKMGEPEYTITDWALVSDWAVDDMEWAVGAGLINGRTVSEEEKTSELAPQDGTKRSELATLLTGWCRDIAE